ncbi:MAG: insulinase family protein [Anaerolineales bacterium]|nr:insulinase family protein [Anaerolineales bacterium]
MTKLLSVPEFDIRSLPGPDTIHRAQTENGITILVRENFSSPSVVISGILICGSLDETPEQASLADLTASALKTGTGSRSFNEIHEALESIGASLGIGSATHSTSFRGKALAADLPVVLEVLSDVLIHPAFPAEEFQRLKSEKLTGLAIRDQDTGAQAGIAFDALAYPEHPYGIPGDGSVETVSALNRSDLIRFHNERYGPRGMIVAITGAIAAAEAEALVAQSLGIWSNPDRVQQPPLPALAPRTGPARQDVFLPGKYQSDLIIGIPGPSRYDPLYLAASIGNSILGRFGLFGRIGDSVREAEGLAYYSYSSVEGGPGPGPWKVSAGVNPANIERAITLITEELKRFISEPVTSEELLENKTHFIGRLPLQLESNEGVASALLSMERYQLGLDYYQQYPQAVQEVTADQILAVARQYIDPGKLVVATAGSSE